MALFIWILAVTVLLSAVNFLLSFSNAFLPLVIIYGWYNIIFFTGMTFVTGIIGMLGASSKNNSTFLLSLMAGFLLKLLFAAAFVLVLKASIELVPKLFFLPFAICYIFFTAVETFYLVKSNNKSDAEQGTKG